MTLFGLLEESAKAYSDKPALVFRGQTTTYGGLKAAVEGFSSGLAKLNAKRVALLLPNCPAFVITYYGASRIGSVVPINILYKPDEVSYILLNSRADVLVTAEPFRHLIEIVRPFLPDLEHVIMVGETQGEELDFRTLCATPPASVPAKSDEDMAVIIYTSGTTGRPKGAMLTHRNIVENAGQCSGVLSIGPDDRFLSALPLFHSFAATVFMNLPIIGGSSIHLMERFLPANTLTMLQEAEATVFGGVPSMFGFLLQVPRNEQPELPRLRLAISGGAPLAPEIWHEFEKNFGTTLVEGYGLTEASPVVAVNPPDGVRKPGSIGLPLPGVDVRIVDSAGCDVPTDEIGELLVRGENVMDGYLGLPEATEEVLRDGWLHTGDLVRADSDGYLYVMGRKKDLIIVGGLNVYPGEVERVLLEHPAVTEAAAFGMENETRGEAVWAAVIMRPDSDATGRDLLAHCRKKLAPYKIPRGVEIVQELPKNALGKVLRHEIRNQVVARVSTER